MTSSLIVPDLQAIAKNLPHLVERNRWLVWNFENVDGRLTKPPRSAKTGATINVKDATQLVSFEEARAAYEAGGFSGVGYSLGDGDVAIDLDKCRNPETGEIDSWAFEIFEQAQSYWEATPSGTGARVIGLGAGPKIHTNLKVPGRSPGAHLEIYRRADRYIAITGSLIEEHEHLEPRDIDPVVDELATRLGGKPKVDRKAQAEGHTALPGGLLLPDEEDLDQAMMALLRGGVPQGHRSETFHQVVTGLRDVNGLTPAQLEVLMRRYPGGIVAKYNGRLRKMIEASWQLVSFEEARAAYEAGRFSGVGYSLGDGDVAIDLDKCWNPETGEIDSWAFEILNRPRAIARPHHREPVRESSGLVRDRKSTRI
jgi:hypothetical protein